MKVKVWLGFMCGMVFGAVAGIYATFWVFGLGLSNFVANNCEPPFKPGSYVCHLSPSVAN